MPPNADTAQNPVKESDVVDIKTKKQREVPKEIVRLREDAPHLVEALKRDKVISQNAEAFAIHGDGQSSAVLYISSEGYDPEILKLRTFGGRAEVMFLDSALAFGAQVPKIKASGIVSGTERTHFLLLEAILTPDGKLASTAVKFLEQYPERAREVGELMGYELSKIHLGTSTEKFGEIGDRSGNRSHHYSEFVNKSLLDQKEIFLEVGISEEELNKLTEQINTFAFPEQGSIVHGDFGLHNTLIKVENPLKIIIIDPNSKIADPYLDLAYLINQLEVTKRLAELEPSEKNIARYHMGKEYVSGVLGAYKEATGQWLDLKRMLANQILEQIKTMRHFKKLEGEGIEKRLAVRESILIEQVKELLNS